jgi:hypothetical protein
MPTEAEIEALLTGIPLAATRTTYHFDESDILNSALRVEHDRSVQYVTATGMDGADRRRHRTTLAGKSGVDAAAIEWDEELFEIAGCKRAISALKRRTSSFSSSVLLLRKFNSSDDAHQ